MEYEIVSVRGTNATPPCRCGYLGNPEFACTRAPKCAAEYQAKISGPLFDRIDIHVEVPDVSPADLALPAAAEGSAEVAARVARARQRQRRRYQSRNGGGGGGERHDGPIIRTNAEADGDLLEQIAGPDAEGRKLLTEAAEKMHLSARGYHRVLRVARTLADLDESENVHRIHIAEAVSYRRIFPGRGLRVA